MALTSIQTQHSNFSQHGLRDGLPADQMSRQLRMFLRQPDKLFRRVRDEHGILQLSKAAKAYHPGRGVYRSSYKNARRLAATETNIAYRTADFERWQSLDFVVGIRVVLSNNHTLNGMPFTDICDYLSAPAKSSNTATSGIGCYPKDFKFTGWHPLCRCHVETILKTEQEMEADDARILAGEEPSTDSVNTVADVPDEFKQWVADNEERATRSFSVPYFVKDNAQYLPKGYLKAYGMKMPYGTYEEYVAAMAYNKKYAAFTDGQKRNNRELSAALPVVQGKIMNFTEADAGRSNTNYTLTNAKDLGYRHNCQTCTMSYELRRRGFNVEAKANPATSIRKRDFDDYCKQKGVNWQDRFLTEDGKRAKYEWSSNIKNTEPAKLQFIEDKTKAQGRYEVYCAWEKGNAHVFVVERQKNGNLLWYDPQSGLHGGASDFDDNYIKKMKHNMIGILRIDDKLINPKFAERLLKARH